MKKLKRVEKILLMLVVGVLICGVSTIIKATEPDVNGIIDINVINTEKESQPQNTNNEPNTNANATNINTNQETALPKTGANDIGLWIIIGASVVLAGYAYKKVRDYNV